MDPQEERARLGRRQEPAQLHVAPRKERASRLKYSFVYARSQAEIWWRAAPFAVRQKWKREICVGDPGPVNHVLHVVHRGCHAREIQKGVLRGGQR